MQQTLKTLLHTSSLSPRQLIQQKHRNRRHSFSNRITAAVPRVAEENMKVQNRTSHISVRDSGQSEIKVALNCEVSPEITPGQTKSSCTELFWRPKLSLRRAKKQPKKTWYNGGSLKSDEDLQKRYAIEVKNRYSSLCFYVSKPMKVRLRN